MRAREWKKAIEDERDKLLAAAQAERESGEYQLKVARNKADQYEITAKSLQAILDRDAENGSDDDEEDEEPENELLVGKGSKAF